MRIITCSKNSITSSISKFIFALIKDLRKTINNCITSTNEFIKRISKIKLNNNDKLLSLDIEDLFSNIPLTRSIDIVIHRLDQSEKFIETSFTKTDIKQILSLCLKNSYFTFNDKFYKQKKGLPMGNSLSPLLADLYMDDYISKHLNDININNKIYRYVDDLLIITDMNEEQAKIYVGKLNKIKGNIRFTHEYEEDKKINFLDTTLTRNEITKEIDIRWFRKATAADRLLNYESAHPQSIKDNIIVNMITRVIEATKNNEQQKEDINKIKQMLIKSNYPRDKIEKSIQNVLRSSANNNNTNNNQQPINNKKEKEKGKFLYSMTLPYAPGIEILKRKLEKLKIKLYFSYPNKINSSLNSNIKSKSKSIIYQMECNCNAIYNGETKVGLEKRMKQHEKSINKKKDSKTSSEIIQHHKNKSDQCRFNPSKAFAIDNEIDFKKRRIKESIYSIINNSINKRDQLNESWYPILQNGKNKILKKIQMKKVTSQEIINIQQHGGQDGDSGTDEET
jgi:predicted GIY-YIG superfamily endonuclease